MTRDFLVRWTIALIVGLALAPLVPDAPRDHPLFVASGVAPIPERTLVRLPDQPRGVLHHYVVPGKVSEDAAGAAGAAHDTD